MHARIDTITSADKLGAYRYVLEHAPEGRTGTLVAYLPAGGSPDRRTEAREALAPFAHEVVDTDDPQARAAFVARIRRLGSETDPQAPLLPEA